MDDDGPSPVAVDLEAGWRDALDDPIGLCRRAVAAALRRAAGDSRLAGAEVSILFADDATVRRLNAAYRGIDRPTDVLSFPAHELSPGDHPGGSPKAPVCLGDIVLAAETVRADAAAEGKPLDAHVCHLLVHGTLHLLGHDHHDEAEAHLMEQLEVAILADLGLGDPYAGRNEAALEATS